MTSEKRLAITMKRLLKLCAFIGGIGAVGWLLQNRIVTVTMSREPREPELAPEPHASGPDSPRTQFMAEARVSVGRDGAKPEPESVTATDESVIAAPPEVLETGTPLEEPEEDQVGADA